jgi:hypothetical protein
MTKGGQQCAGPELIKWSLGSDKISDQSERFKTRSELANMDQPATFFRSFPGIASLL